ncbi:zinc-ribbon domain-containing protein [Devosia aquimaris]|uniref:zinc-ribbon domain-containing protein n=1 Tax=Devosia aquimaris TaxID=2866214 RepID=UPI001CD17F33|nr:zinc-ribbon domain-containing protein [Devosia sp. CJK-A8-3]
MIISCPHCQTKYQVTYEAIGATGRKVQCAHCQEAWQQAPLPKEEPPASPEVRKAEEAIAEDSLDEAMASAEKDAAAKARKASSKADKQALAAARGAGKIDPAEVRRRRRNFSRPQSASTSELPMARARGVARVVAVLALLGTGAGAYFGRTQIVQQFPAMAGIYDRLGLGVNVVGLDFAGLSTLRTTRNGKEMLIVSAQIVGLRPSPAPVPAVVVTLLDDDGNTVYQWSVDPLVHDLMAGERATLDTQLSQPPASAARVRLAFAESALPPAPGPTAARAGAGETAGDGHGTATTEADGHGTDAHGTVAPAADGHDAAADGHAAPAADHAVPADDHAAPADPHAAPADAHAAPADGHAAPDEGHAAPADGHAEPASNHAAPATEAHGDTTSDAAAGHGAAASDPVTPEHH